MKDRLKTMEKEEEYSRERAEKYAAEASKLQLQLNNLNMQLYGKDESIKVLQQQLNALMMKRHDEVLTNPISIVKTRHIEEPIREKNRINSTKITTARLPKCSPMPSYKEPTNNFEEEKDNDDNKEMLLPSQEKYENKLKNIKSIEGELLKLQLKKKEVICIKIIVGFRIYKTYG